MTLYKQIIQPKDELELNYVTCTMNKLKSNKISVKSMVKSPENQKILKSVPFWSLVTLYAEYPARC